MAEPEAGSRWKPATRADTAEAATAVATGVATAPDMALAMGWRPSELRRAMQSFLK